MRFDLPTDEEAWRRLPASTRGGGQPLPSWARILAVALPRSTAALLQLDRAQRTLGPVDPKLRAAMRLVAARANRCAFTEADAGADALRAGLDADGIESLGRDGSPGWPEAERRALDFARKMTVDSASVTDAEFATLVEDFGARRAASMVLLLAHANFQDRLVLTLGATLEPGRPRPPLDVAFDPAAFTARTTPPPPLAESRVGRSTHGPAGDRGRRGEVAYQRLQSRMEVQRCKPTRLRIPAWEEVAANLPDGPIRRPNDIVWYRICFGYAPELAIPFETFMRTAGDEAGPGWDRVFAQGLFWVTTEAVDCPYCMGHCEMNWEVAGLSPGEIAERSQLLAGGDWSAFPPAERRAFAFAKKLAAAPWSSTDEDVAGLVEGFGHVGALLVILNASRHHYMTRISNGFQLGLERTNVFHDYYEARPRIDPGPARTSPEIDLI